MLAGLGIMLTLYKQTIKYQHSIESYYIENVRIINYYYINQKGTRLLSNIPI